MSGKQKFFLYALIASLVAFAICVTTVADGVFIGDIVSGISSIIFALLSVLKYISTLQKKGTVEMDRKVRTPVWRNPDLIIAATSSEEITQKNHVKTTPEDMAKIRAQQTVEPPIPAKKSTRWVLIGAIACILILAGCSVFVATKFGGIFRSPAYIPPTATIQPTATLAQTPTVPCKGKYGGCEAQPNQSTLPTLQIDPHVTSNTTMTTCLGSPCNTNFVPYDTKLVCPPATKNGTIAFRIGPGATYDVVKDKNGTEVRVPNDGNQTAKVKGLADDATNKDADRLFITVVIDGTSYNGFIHSSCAQKLPYK